MDHYSSPGTIRLSLSSILPTMAVLMVLNPTIIGSGFSLLFQWIRRLHSSLDILLFTIAVLVVVALVGVVLFLYGMFLFVQFVPTAALFTILAFAADSVLHRPFLTMLLAILVGWSCAIDFERRRSVSLLVICYAAALVPALLPASPYRWIALITSIIMFLRGLLVAGKLQITLDSDLFSPGRSADDDTSFSFECFYLLTIGAFTWAQLSELFGWRIGSLCYIPIAYVVPTAFFQPLLKQKPISLTAQAGSSVPAFAPGSLKEFLARLPMRQWSWDAIVCHLSYSRYAVVAPNGVPVREVDHLFLGFRADSHNNDQDGYDPDNRAHELPEPVLLHRESLKRHIHILGRTSTGKTSLGIVPLVTQLLRKRSSFDEHTQAAVEIPPDPVIILDLKGDPALFSTVYEEAKNRGQKFLFFQPDTRHPTCFFNPFSHFNREGEKPDTARVIQGLLDSLGLNHGEGYGRSYFTRESRSRLMAALNQRGTPRSFKELHEWLTATPRKRGASKASGDELHNAIEVFLLYPQLFPTKEDEKQRPGSVIDFHKVLEERQVVYFWLPAGQHSMVAREIGKFALFSLFGAAMTRVDDEKERRQAYIFIDEFQCLAGVTLSTILEQARSYGLATILSNHSVSQLKTAAGQDLWDAINGNTAATINFGTHNDKDLDILSRASGERWDYVSRTTSSTSSSARTSTYDPMWDTLAGYDISDGHSSSASVTEGVVPRWKPHELLQWFSQDANFVLWLHRDIGLSRYNGLPIKVRGMYSMDAQTYSRRDQDFPWKAVAGLLPPPKRLFDEPVPESFMNDTIRDLFR